MKRALNMAALVFVMGIAFLVESGIANAETKDVWHGWMNLTPCSRVEWNNNGIFGTPSPTTRIAPQELHGYISVDLPNDQTVINMVTNCAEKGVAAAGLVSVLTHWGAAWPTFNATFQQCLKDAPKDILSKSVNFRSDSSCKW